MTVNTKKSYTIVWQIPATDAIALSAVLRSVLMNELYYPIDVRSRASALLSIINDAFVAHHDTDQSPNRAMLRLSLFDRNAGEVLGLLKYLKKYPIANLPEISCIGHLIEYLVSAIAAQVKSSNRLKTIIPF